MNPSENIPAIRWLIDWQEKGRSPTNDSSDPEDRENWTDRS